MIEERNLTHVKVGLFDIDGVMRGKYLNKEKFYSALDNGFAFCDVVLGWDCNDQLYENPGVKYTGWHTGYPDAPVRIVVDSCRDIQNEPNMLLFLVEFADKAAALCPRNLLQRVKDKASNMGFDAFSAFEYEFFLFNETPDSVREKGYQNLKPFTPGFFGYSMLRNSVHAPLHESFLKMAEIMDFPIEGLHTETGPGVMEAAITYDESMKAADKAALFKTYTKIWAQQNGLMATFMAKWSNDYPGQSGHIHLSLRDKKSNKSVFYDEKAPHHMSKKQRQFIAGQQRLMPELLAMIAPTVNAYSRMIPGFWAPTHATWGAENRTTALRVISGSDKSQRVEYRLGAADANPYIALAAALGSGLYGVEHELEPEEAIEGNAYSLTHSAALALPKSLAGAADRLIASDAARDLFGDAFVEHFAATRHWEENEYRKHISDWELKRYFEII
jgi:glutamine synthetase